MVLLLGYLAVVHSEGDVVGVGVVDMAVEDRGNVGMREDRAVQGKVERDKVEKDMVERGRMGKHKGFCSLLCFSVGKCSTRLFGVIVVAISTHILLIFFVMFL